MTNKGKVILAIVVLLVVGVGAYVLTKGDDKEDSNTTNTTSNSSSSSEENADTGDAVQSASITYSDSGFSPSEVTVFSGGTITVSNQSDETVGFKSDPHPVHTNNDELNLDDLGPGDSKTFSVERVGTWGYHNHLNPDQAGTIVVVEQ